VTFANDADSRDYLFSFSIAGPQDVPPDFGDCLPGPLVSGVFLPRDDRDWLGRSTTPPRLLLLYDKHIQLIYHPRSRRSPQRISLEDVVAVESGHALLLGWIRLIESGEAIDIRYNRRTKQPVEQWLAALRASVCPPCHSEFVSNSAHFGEGIDYKFKNARDVELDRAETVEASWFIAPAPRNRSYWMFSRRYTEAGNLLLVTDRRVLWITDKLSNSYDRYGYVARYSSLAETERFSIDQDRPLDSIAVRFRGNRQWLVPAPHRDTSDAELFVRAANAALVREMVRP
jgi:hypothetical protein